MYLYTVKTCLDGVPRSIGIVTDSSLNVVLRHYFRLTVVRANCYRTRAHNLIPMFSQVLRPSPFTSDTTKCPQLEPDITAFGVDRVDNLLPPGDLLIVPDSGNVVVAPCSWRNEGRLGNDQSSWYTRTLLVICFGVGTWRGVCVGSETGQWSHYHTMLESVMTELEWLEQALTSHFVLRVGWLPRRIKVKHR